MPSLADRLATKVVKAMGLKGRLTRLAEVENDPDELAEQVRKLRRFSRPSPPRRIRRRWTVEMRDASGHDLHVATSRQGRSGRVILHLHGGGYMFGPFGTDWAACDRLASNAGCDFAVLDYPKVPEHQAPETISATRHAFGLLAADYGAGNVILTGVSAGGGLALAAMMQNRDEGGTLPAMAILISPGVDMTLDEPIGELEPGDALLSVAHVRSAGRLYAGALGADHPSVSPLFGDLGQLPPLHVFAGTAEILYPSLRTFVTKAREAGSGASLIVGEGQQHTWPLSPTPDGRRALDEIAGIIGAAG
ncbi:MAG: alpha/beta hydrolase fold domain-containing protein [Acidimicrobiia bacterium]|nr:alpha/beta hydrolase fold domain-containing protein [Acidimicrobiia bacterium]